MKVFYISLVFLIFIGISVVAFYNLTLRKNVDQSSVNTTNVYEVDLSEKDLPPIPILKSEAEASPQFTAESIFVVDVHSGVSLLEKNPDEKLLPASTTKIITALVAMDHYRSEEVVTIGKINVPGQKMGLVNGEMITAGDLISGLLIYSANDAAEALAQAFPGGREKFVEAMNLKSDMLHLENTNFTNPSGLDGLGLTTTARDLARESIVAMKIPFFRQIVGTKELLVQSVDGVYKHKLVNINELIGEVPGVLGIKTGWTENAKENLVSYVERGDWSVVFVVLKSADRFGETKNLIEWVFNNYEWKEIAI